MKENFDVVVGLSDHTMGNAVSVGGVAIGAQIIEKNMILRRADGGADSKFSMEPEEFKEIVGNIRIFERTVENIYLVLEEINEQKDITRFL